MLELEIKQLKEEVQELRSVLSEMITVLKGAPSTASATPSVKTEKVELKEVAPEDIKPQSPAITHDTLQELCASMVRENRDLKVKIKDVIASFDGATNLRMVKPESLVMLKHKLEEL